MAIAAPDSFFVGGAVSTGPASGDYHVIIEDASLGSSSSGRGSLNFDLVVKDDPNHPAKEGKKLTKMFNSLADPKTDDEEKIKVMNGILKRQVYDGFGIKWPTDKKALDARQFIGKTAWIRLAPRTNPKTGEARTQVTAVAQTADKLPVNKTTGEPAADLKAGGRSRR